MCSRQYYRSRVTNCKYDTFSMDINGTQWEHVCIYRMGFPGIIIPRLSLLPKRSQCICTTIYHTNASAGRVGSWWWMSIRARAGAATTMRFPLMFIRSGEREKEIHQQNFSATLIAFVSLVYISIIKPFPSLLLSTAASPCWLPHYRYVMTHRPRTLARTSNNNLAVLLT